MTPDGAQAQFELLNGPRPTDPDKFDSAEDFVGRCRWWDDFHRDAFPRYCRSFRLGMKAALRAMGRGRK